MLIPLKDTFHENDRVSEWKRFFCLFPRIVKEGSLEYFCWLCFLEKRKVIWRGKIFCDDIFEMNEYRIPEKEN